MDRRILILLFYLLITIFFGLVFQKKARESRTEFFLAGRNLSRLFLFFTMASTNFSAFTIFGFSGAGYRMGYAFYPVMGFGTGFMALSFFIIGSKILYLSGIRGYITPSDYVLDRYNSLFLKKLFSFVMIVFTLPYIAIQAIASGSSIQSLLGIPYLTGVFLITAFVVAYVTLGGMRSIVWTDLLQGLMMIGFILTGLILIARRSGGFLEVHKSISESFPLLLQRPGQGKTMSSGIWFGYMFLWFFADPMFPQLFQRFMAARNMDSLKSTVIFYPLITTFLFFLTVSIGVIGRATFHDLPAASSDNIFPLLLGKYASPFLGTLILTGGIAALMSTMDSQLLTLTSMITLDFFKLKKKEILIEKLTAIGIGISGFLIAIYPPQTILDFINKTTFYGLSVLSPTVLGGLYWKKANKYGAILSIITGEGMVLAYYFGFIHTPWILPVVPILAATGIVFVAVSILTVSKDENKEIVFKVGQDNIPWIIIFSLIFILGNDFWNWGKTPVLLAGLPLWVWYYFGLGIIMSLAFKFYLRTKR